MGVPNGDDVDIHMRWSADFGIDPFTWAEMGELMTSGGGEDDVHVVVNGRVI